MLSYVFDRSLITFYTFFEFAMTVCVDDMLPVIYRFLVSSGFIKAAKALQKVSEEDLSVVKCGLHKKKLMGIVKSY